MLSPWRSDKCLRGQICLNYIKHYTQKNTVIKTQHGSKLICITWCVTYQLNVSYKRRNTEVDRTAKMGVGQTLIFNVIYLWWCLYSFICLNDFLKYHRHISLQESLISMQIFEYMKEDHNIETYAMGRMNKHQFAVSV
jgi:hypothetical protein